MAGKQPKTPPIHSRYFVQQSVTKEVAQTSDHVPNHNQSRLSRISNVFSGSEQGNRPCHSQKSNEVIGPEQVPLINYLTSTDHSNVFDQREIIGDNVMVNTSVVSPPFDPSINQVIGSEQVPLINYSTSTDHTNVFDQREIVGDNVMVHTKVMRPPFDPSINQSPLVPYNLGNGKGGKQNRPTFSPHSVVLIQKEIRTQIEVASFKYLKMLQLNPLRVT